MKWVRIMVFQFSMRIMRLTVITTFRGSWKKMDIWVSEDSVFWPLWKWKYFDLLEVQIGILPTVWESFPKDEPETCYRNFDPPWREWLPRFDTPRGIIWMGTWRTLHPRRILHAPGAISVHGSFRQASLEPGPSGQELRTLSTRQLRAGTVKE